MEGAAKEGPTAAADGPQGILERVLRRRAVPTAVAGSEAGME